MTDWTKPLDKDSLLQLTVRDIVDALNRLTKGEIYDLTSKLWSKLQDPIVFQSGATKTDKVNSIVRWLRRASGGDRVTFINALQAKLAEKEQYPVRGEVPGTRYIKWDDFTRLESYPRISRALHYPHDHRRKCSPVTKDGYVSVDAVYNMSAWKGWKYSSLDPREAQVAREISALPLHHLMVLHKGRRMDQPALFPVSMLPMR